MLFNALSADHAHQAVNTPVVDKKVVTATIPMPAKQASYIHRNISLTCLRPILISIYT